MTLAVAILAAGESRRMGQPKALVPFAGSTFVEHLLAATRHPRVGITRVILGAGAEVISQSLKLDPATIVVNAHWPAGQLSSIHAAIRSLPAGATEGLIVCPVDHPLVSHQLLARLIQSFDSGNRLIVLPVYKMRRGHPVIFRATLYEELLAASPDIGARQVVWNHATEISEVETDEEGVVLNLNDPETLRVALGN